MGARKVLFWHHNALALGFHNNTFRAPMAEALLHIAGTWTATKTQWFFAVVIAHKAFLPFPTPLGAVKSANAF